MKKKHLEVFLKSSSPLPTTQAALEAFLQDKDIIELSKEHKIAYKTWENFLKKQVERSQGTNDLWSFHEPSRQFFRLWRLQDSALPFLLSRYQFHKKGGLEVRKHELKKAGLVLSSKIMGIKTASSYHKYGCWRWDNAVRIPYLRLCYRRNQPFRQDVEYFLHGRLNGVVINPSEFSLAGTPLIKKKVECLWSSRVEVADPIRLCRGLYAVKMSCPKAFSGDEQAPIQEASIGRYSLGVTGSIFSVYQLYASIYPQKILPPLTSPIEDTLSEQTFPKFFLAGQDLMASYLLESLKKCQKLLKEDSIRLNPSVEASIHYLKQYIGWMKIYKNDFERFSLLFEMAFEEVCLFLMMGNRYLQRDYKTILDNSYVVPETFYKQHFFMSSGMDALTIAVLAALKDHPDSGVHISKGNYFEVEHCFQHAVKKVDHLESIVIFNLNTTCYFENKMSLSDIESWLSTQEKGKPVTLIVDNTLEAPISLESLFKVVNPWIEAGVLNLILCKSQQKYAGFGLAKVMSGNITVLHQSELFKESLKFLNEVDAENDYYKKPEFQIMACQLELNAKFGFEARATLLSHNKAKFIAAMCPETFADAESEFFLYLFYPAALKSDIGYLLDVNGLERRESFGFLRCSYVEIDDSKLYHRINVGFESNERLVEKLYNFYILKNYGFDTGALYLHLKTELQHFSTTNENYLHNKVASIFLLFLSILNKRQLSPDFILEEGAVDTIYKDYIHCSPYVTQEQKRGILRLLFAHKISSAITEEQALNALKQVYFSLSNDEIFKVLRSMSEAKEDFIVILMKEMAKKSNLVHPLSKEISFYMQRDRFVFATQLLRFFLEEYKDHCAANFNLIGTLKAFLKYVSEFHLRKVDPLLEANYLQFSRVICMHYPDIIESQSYRALKEALTKASELPVAELSLGL